MHTVCFRYTRTSPWIVHNMDLQARAGAFTFIIGPSGQGKSTLFLLILKMLVPECGTVAINERNLASVTAAAVRRAIGLVPQEPLFFRQSLRFNLLYGLAEALPRDDAAIWDALERVQIAGRLRGLARGLDEDAMRGLSLGERQRVSVASILLRKPAVALLDEPTSALDEGTAVRLWETLRQELTGITAIAIVHQLFVIRPADDVVALAGGAVEAAGALEHVRQASRFASDAPSLAPQGPHPSAGLD